MLLNKKYKVVKISPYSMILYAELNKQYLCPCHCLGKIGTLKEIINNNYFKIEFDDVSNKNKNNNLFSIFYYKDLELLKN